jgi:hypothetical protein
MISIIGISVIKINMQNARCNNKDKHMSNKVLKPYTWSNNRVRELELRGIVHYEFVPTGQTVNQVYYLEVLKRLREKVRRK